MPSLSAPCAAAAQAWDAPPVPSCVMRCKAIWRKQLCPLHRPMRWAAIYLDSMLAPMTWPASVRPSLRKCGTKNAHCKPHDPEPRTVARLKVKSETKAPPALRQVVADSRPLLALFNRADHWHVPVLQWLQSNPKTHLLTTWPVLTEVRALLARRLGNDCALDFLR